MKIRPATSTDGLSLSNIYNDYVKNTVITFEEEVVSAAAMGQRVVKVHDHNLPWLIAEVDHTVVGYAYAAPWKERSAYRFSVETTIYLDAEHCRTGYGTQLYQQLFDEIRRCGMRVAVGGIALPNAGSIALHEKMGMQKVAHFAEVGFKFGQWVDVGYWQCKL